MTNPPAPRSTAAFQLQAVLSFGVSTVSVLLGIAYLPVGPWVRAFLALGLLYVVTSAFTLAKTLRDQQEASAVWSRVDEARLQKLLAGHDPFATPPAGNSAEPDDHLAGVVAAQQAAEGLDGAADPLDDRLAGLQLPGRPAPRRPRVRNASVRSLWSPTSIPSMRSRLPTTCMRLRGAAGGSVAL